MNEPKNRMKKTEERICGPEDRMIDIANMKERETRLKKKGRASRT